MCLAAVKYKNIFSFSFPYFSGEKFRYFRPSLLTTKYPSTITKLPSQTKEHPQSPRLYQLPQEKEWPKYPASKLRARKSTTKDLKLIKRMRRNQITFKYIVQYILVSISHQLRLINNIISYTAPTNHCYTVFNIIHIF